MLFKISDRTYDILKWLVMLVFPAIATFYATMAETLGLAMGPEVVATVGALTVFLGAYLQMNMVEFARTTPYNPGGRGSYPFSMTSDLYDTLKWLVKVGLPGFSVVYVSLAAVWGFGMADVIPIIATALALLLGSVLQISSVARARKIASFT